MLLLAIAIAFIAIFISILAIQKANSNSKLIDTFMDDVAGLQSDLDEIIVDNELKEIEEDSKKKKKSSSSKKQSSQDITPEDFLVWKNKKIPREFLYPKKDLEDNGHVLFGKKVVISGTFDAFPVRYELAEFLWNIGVDVDTSVGKNTDYLFCGSGCGPSKRQKAEDNDVIIANEEKIKKLISGFKSRFV